MRSGRRPPEGVEVARTITLDDLGLGAEVLHRETKMIKFDRNKIISGELTDRNKIFYKFRCY